MQTEQARQILQQFGEHRQTVARNKECRWSWATGVVLFPDAICGLCGGLMHSNRIWLTGPRRLNGQIKLEDGRLVRELPSHPHADNTGYICMSSARDVHTALFLGMSTAHSLLQRKNGKNWRSVWEKWNVDKFDHECGSACRKFDSSENRLVAN